MSENKPSRPKGSMGLDDLKKAVKSNTPIFRVHKFNNSRTRLSATLIHPKKIESHHEFTRLIYETKSVINEKETISDYLCVGDYNIGSSHNSHYLFTNKDLAEKYMSS